jgi:hypothetical protein
MARQKGDTTKNQGGRPLTYNAEPAISLDVSADDINAVKHEVKAKTSALGRKGTGRKVVKKSPEDHLPASDALAITSTDLALLPDVLQSAQVVEPVQVAQAIRRAEAGLTEAQKHAVEVLADVVVRRSVPQCADEVGVSAQAVYTWFANPVFTAALELRKRENFINVARIKMYDVYLKEVDKAVPSSRMTEQIAKTLGFFSDNDSINIEINVDASGEQNNLEVNRDGSY